MFRIVRRYHGPGALKNRVGPIHFRTRLHNFLPIMKCGRVGSKQGFTLFHMGASKKIFKYCEPENLYYDIKFKIILKYQWMPEIGCTFPF